MSQPSSLSRLQELLPQLFQPSEVKGDRYLRFGINQQISVLLPMENVQESLLVSAEKITPIPNMPPPFIGLMSSRDSVFCVFDLPHVMGLSPLSPYLRQYHIVVVSLPVQKASNLLLGIAVHQIQGITRILPGEVFNQFQGENLPKQLLSAKLRDYFKDFYRDRNDSNVGILNIQTVFSKITSSQASSLYSPIAED